MKHSKKQYIWIVLSLGLLACTQAPALKIYSLQVPSVQGTYTGKYHSKSIKVTYPQSLREQMSQKMNFSYSSSDYGTYQNSVWSNDMSKLLQGTLIEVLEDARLFKVVLSNTSTLKENLRLESNIFAFEHRVRGTESHAIISVQFTLINADSGRLLKSKRFSYSVATESIDAQGYAKATNVAIARLSKDLLIWLKSN